MSTNAIITRLKARLEVERNDEMTAYELCTGQVGYRNGHEAATARLLPLLEKAVENIEKLVHKLESSNRYDESCGVTNWEESEPEKQRYDIHKEATKKAREFLNMIKDEVRVK